MYDLSVKRVANGWLVEPGYKADVTTVHVDFDEAVAAVAEEMEVMEEHMANGEAKPKKRKKKK